MRNCCATSVLVFSVSLGGSGVMAPAVAMQTLAVRVSAVPTLAVQRIAEMEPAVLALEITEPAVRPQDRSGAAGKSSVQEKVDLNHATRQQLLTLPGVTAVWAGRIEAGRPFASKTQLLTRGIVPRNLYLEIRDRVVAHRERQ